MFVELNCALYFCVLLDSVITVMVSTGRIYSVYCVLPCVGLVCCTVTFGCNRDQGSNDGTKEREDQKMLLVPEVRDRKDKLKIMTKS